MTINELLYACVDASLLKLTIYDLESGEDVWSGDADEVPGEYEYLEIESWDVPNKGGELTVNVTINN